jgi:hypothetical protein
LRSCQPPPTYHALADAAAAQSSAAGCGDRVIRPRWWCFTPQLSRRKRLRRGRGGGRRREEDEDESERRLVLAFPKVKRGWGGVLCHQSATLRRQTGVSSERKEHCETARCGFGIWIVLISTCTMNGVFHSRSGRYESFNTARSRCTLCVVVFLRSVFLFLSLSLCALRGCWYSAYQ